MWYINTPLWYSYGLSFRSGFSSGDGHLSVGSFSILWGSFGFSFGLQVLLRTD